MKAEQWLRGMDTIFNALGYEDQDKKRLAVFQLTYSTAKWWEAEKAASGEEVIGRLSWVDFKTKFLESISLIQRRTRKKRNSSTLCKGPG